MLCALVMNKLLAYWLFWIYNRSVLTIIGKRERSVVIIKTAVAMTKVWRKLRKKKLITRCKWFQRRRWTAERVDGD